jgi:hypothetical protein
MDSAGVVDCDEKTITIHPSRETFAADGCSAEWTRIDIGRRTIWS